MTLARVLAFDDPIARVLVSETLVVDLVVRRSPAGDARVVLPDRVVAIDLPTARAIERETLRQLVARGDVAPPPTHDAPASIEVRAAPSARISTRAGGTPAAEQRVLDALATAGEPLTRAEIRDRVSGAQLALTALIARGGVHRTGAGTRSDPFRYSAALPPGSESQNVQFS